MAERLTYGHYEIQQYLQRKMSPQQMHDFERALMDDPFLADAIEGFTAANTSLTEKHLAEIESNLSNERQKARIVPLPVRQTSWWKVAAIIVVIVSAGLLTFGLLSKNEVNDQISTASAPAANKIIEKQDTVGPVDKPIAAIDVLPKKDIFYKRKFIAPGAEAAPDFAQPQMSTQQVMSDTISSQQKAETANDVVIVGYGAARRNTTTNEVLSGKVAGIQEVTPKEFKGKVIDAMGEPMPFASVRAKNKSVATVSDSKGNFTLSSRDSVLNIDVSAAGYVRKDAKLKDDSTLNKVVLQEDKMSLSEVVVTDLAKRKRTNLSNANNAATATNAAPEGGFKNFEEYVRRQVDSLKSDKKNGSLNDEILLEFSIDKKGRPVHITAPKEENKTAIKKAKLILSQGPKWKNSGNEKRVKVIIPF
ncbi:MAG TPA: carboxypeptidase-like regulatory domain-containing protein [Segetibacter sp.]|jgi:hypothetical protein